MEEDPRLPVVRDWFHVTWVTAGVAMLTEPHVDGLIRANLWYVRGRERDLLVDTGNGIAPLRPLIERLSRGRHREVVAVVTHAHIDHVGGLHEFEHRLFHRLERAAAAAIEPAVPLATGEWPGYLREQLADAGFVLPPLLLDAVPDEAFDPVAFRIAPVAATRFVEGGDQLDLGDRKLLVVDLPGHTQGSIGLLDEASGALFSGDAVYDGSLIDTLPESDVAAYARTMERLRELPVEVVYPGHDEPFGREALRRLCDAYLRRRG
jgi:glyoxylase-like metal-dependent hydrolase (beta-lactamase superfamily II)